MVQDYDLAMAFWQLFKTAITAHVEVENELLFKAFAEHVKEPRWPAMLYEKEHEKIVAMMAKAEGLLAQLQNTDRDASQRRRQILAVLEYQRSFKNVIEHHEEREEIALLQELEQFAPQDLLQSLYAVCEQRWLLPHKQLREQRLALASRLP